MEESLFLPESFEEDLHQYYPSWPYVNLGTDSTDVQQITVPEPMNEDDLVRTVNLGRHLNRLLECNVSEAYHVMTQNLGWPPDPQYYQTRENPTPFNQAWTATNTSKVLDNRGFVSIDENRELRSEDGRVVDRRYDYLLSILESLPIGSDSSNTKWERPRTASSIVYPYGPNLRLRLAQDKEYHITDPATSTLFNWPIHYSKKLYVITRLLANSLV
jgi:hypothetical protein